MEIAVEKSLRSRSIKPRRKDFNDIHSSRIVGARFIPESHLRGILGRCGINSKSAIPRLCAKKHQSAERVGLPFGHGNCAYLSPFKSRIHLVKILQSFMDCKILTGGVSWFMFEHILTKIPTNLSDHSPDHSPHARVITLFP
ncbi:MAG: hypothetical protein G01um101433_596 [Parcubacteria group bacterium Gr01-1014_33]|nr:MAG: hypothetical protein G01um101433_596 [Parcubacteria group bacterium Gr01-1014_33]